MQPQSSYYTNPTPFQQQNGLNSVFHYTIIEDVQTSNTDPRYRSGWDHSYMPPNVNANSHPKVWNIE